MENFDKIAANWNYLINITNPGYKSTKTYFDANLAQVIPFSYPTLYNLIKRGKKKCSDCTKEKMVHYFNSCLKESDRAKKILSIESLEMDPKELQAKFKPDDFKTFDINTNKILSQNKILERFANKLYRCYYLTPNSPNAAYIAFIKIFNKKDACLIKGIRIENLKSIQSLFMNDNFMQCKTLEEMRKSFFTTVNTMKDSFKPEQMHFYKAEKIILDPDCIRIDFISEENSPCHTSIFWNVSIVNRLGIKPYIGGAALAIDTNQGNRGKDICSYKLGIETLEKSRLDDDVLVNPFDCSSVELLNELSLSQRNGISLVDNAADNRFFRFITEEYHRIPNLDKDEFKKPRSYSEEDVAKIVEHLIESQRILKKEIAEVRYLKRNILKEHMTKECH